MKTAECVCRMTLKAPRAKDLMRPDPVSIAETATVREAVCDPDIAGWLNRLLFEEVVPTLEGRVEAPEAFARQVLERFRNPFLEHQFKDIAAYHDAKVKIRLVPTRAEFVDKFGRVPKLLDEAISWRKPASL